jgi:hypothetical protein
MEREVAALLALTLGRPLPAADASWPEVLDLARRERCAPLAWLRSAAEIRRASPAEVAQAWRAEAMAAVSLADFWRDLTLDTITALRGANVEATVLKGLPLGSRLYGDAAARPCSDLDLYVSAAERGAAHEALIASGWRWQAGRAPRESGYRMERRGRLAVLELHSALLDDGLVSHLPFEAPEQALGVGASEPIPAHDDAQLPAFLAAHLAKHSTAPVLWLIDLATLWSSLDAESRAAARIAARSARAERYLDWALRRVSRLDAAAVGDTSALRELGFGARRRREMHSAVRVALLASQPLDAFRVAVAWLAPHDVRGSGRAMAGLFRARVKKAIAGAGWRFRGSRLTADARPARPIAGTSDGVRSLHVTDEEFGALLSDLVERGMRFSIRAHGASMLPSIPPGTLVSLAPLGSRSARVGDVVLTRDTASRYVLHRVSAIGDSWVQTWGDGNMKRDPRLPLTSIVAIAGALVIDGRECPIPATGAQHGGKSFGEWRRGVTRLFATAVGRKRQRREWPAVTRVRTR